MARKKSEEEQPPEPTPKSEEPPAPSGDEARTSDPDTIAALMVESSATRDPDATVTLPGAGVNHPSDPQQPPASADPEAPYGRFKNGKPRKKPAPGARGLVSQIAPATPQAQPGMSLAECTQVASFCNGTFFMILQGMLGDDGAPQAQEKEALNGALANYLQTQNIPLTPGLALSLMYAGVLVNRLQKPTVRKTLREKLALAYVRIKSRVTGRRLVAKDEKERTQSDDPPRS